MQWTAQLSESNIPIRGTNPKVFDSIDFCQEIIWFIYSRVTQDDGYQL